MVVKLSNDFWHFMPLEEDSLRHSIVLNLGLGNIECFVREIVVNFNLSDSKILQTMLDDMLLEIGIEPQNFTIVFDPRRLNSGDGIILRPSPLVLEAKVRDALGKLVN